jgi:hypothetical protein
MAQVFAISINGGSLIPSQFALWAVKAMRQKRRTEDEKSRLPFLPLFRTTAGN